MTSVFLLLFVIACIRVAANRQFKLDSWVAEYSNCSLEVRKLTGIAGEYGKEQLEELESCRKELYDLGEQRANALSMKSRVLDEGDTRLQEPGCSKMLKRKIRVTSI